MSANLWISDIRHILTPTIYAVVQPLGLSGILLILPAVFWAVIEPLHLRHKVNLDDTLPAVVGIGGGFLVLAYVLTGGQPVSIPALNITLLLVGAFFVSESIQWLGQKQGAPIPYRGLRLGAQVAVMVVAMFVAMPSIKALFYATRASAYSVRGNWEAAGSDRMREAIENTGPFSGRTLLEEAAASTQFREWATAEALYGRIISDPEAGVQNRSLAIYNRIRTYLARNDLALTPAQLTEMLTALDALLIQPDQMDRNGLMIHALENIPIAHASVRETQADVSFLLGDTQGALGYLRQALAVAQEPLLIRQLSERIANQR